MSIIVSNLSYSFPTREALFDRLSFTVGQGQKASLIGDNGSGKSTLLNVLSGALSPTAGQIAITGPLYFAPQHFGQYDHRTIAEALGAEGKIASLRSILAGSTDEHDYELLGEDWDIEDRVKKEMERWDIGYLPVDCPFSNLSGGEKTKVFLAGIGVHSPSVILMDEPTNHLDRRSRLRLYDIVQRSPATILIVSHDRELLNLMDTTLELSSKGIARYGGNYDFYKGLHDEHMAALRQDIEHKERSIRLTGITARKAVERKEKTDARGEKKQKKAGVPRIMMNTIRDGAEKSATKLKDTLTQKLEKEKQNLLELRRELRSQQNLKIAVKGSGLHKGKILFKAEGINFGYDPLKPLWPTPLDFLICSGDRLQIEGSNGSGKTTLVRIITGGLAPTSGEVQRADFRWLYIDQEYSFIDISLTVLQQVEKHNPRNLPDHELKTELSRFLFPQAAWDKSCASLSGGEKMRLMLCCLLVSNDSPDMFILDEPTNNLDIRSMEILASVMKEFRGSILLISHDSSFAEEIGITGRLCL